MRGFFTRVTHFVADSFVGLVKSWAIAVIATLGLAIYPCVKVFESITEGRIWESMGWLVVDAIASWVVFNTGGVIFLAILAGSVGYHLGRALVTAVAPNHKGTCHA